MRMTGLFAALALYACGGAAPLPDGRLLVRAAAGSGYLTGCVTGDSLWALRFTALERWTLPEDGAAALTRRVALPAPGRGAAPLGVGCEGERVLVVRADGTALGFVGEALAFEGAAPSGWPAVDGGDQAPEGWTWAKALPGERLAALGPKGQAVFKGGELLSLRRAAGGLKDATWDGAAVFAVGDQGLSRWTPGRGEPTPLPIPPSLKLPLTGVFRDGPWAWLRDSVDQGVALLPGQMTVGASGPLPPKEGLLRLGVVAPPARGQKGEAVVLEVHPRPGERSETYLNDQRIETAGEVTELALLSPGLVLAGVGEGLELWAVSAKGVVVRDRLALPGRVARVLPVSATEAQVVGTEAGFFTVEVTPPPSAE